MKSILLLHGWNDDNYTSRTKSKDAWDNRKRFVDKLSKKYKIYKLNFPGFCGQPEYEKPFDLDEYARFVHLYLLNNRLKVDYILGYSFGGAVAVRYNNIYDNKQKIILVSPAISRKYSSKNIKVIYLPSIIYPIRRFLRDMYLIHIVKNPYMKYGTPFLRESYQIIVRQDIVDKVKDINKKNVTIIIGEKDEMINTNKILNELNEYDIHVIKNGKHDIANTHTDELISIISK